MDRILLYKRLAIAGAVAIAFAQNAAQAATQEYIADYCTVYSVDRLVQEDKVDEMDLRDQYDLIDKYFADCMTKQKADIRKEAAYVEQSVFFN